MPKKLTYFSRKGEGSWVAEVPAVPCGGGRDGHCQHTDRAWRGRLSRLRASAGREGLAGTAPRRQQGSDADPGQRTQRGAVSLGCSLLPGFTEGHGAQSLALRTGTALDAASHRPLHHPAAQRALRGTKAALSAPAQL